jgi:hypothetical protein
MQKDLNMRVLAIAVIFAFSAPSFAQQVITTVVGSPANFEIEARVVSPDLKQCSALVTQPNGSTEIVILKAPQFKTSFSYTPTVQGTTVVTWRGEATLNGQVENAVVGGVKQLFNNIGELVTLSKMSQIAVACPGNGTITIVATPPRVQSIAAPAPSPTPAPAAVTPPVQTSSRFKATANIPPVMNPPIESSAFKAKYSSDSTYRTMVDDFNINRSKQSLTALRLYSELGDANAQFLYGLAHMEDWTGLYDLKKACYWIRESAVQGLSQARLVLANKAIYNKDCFDIPPTLDEAKTWAQLASMSTEKAVKENADKLLQDILRIQITNQR